MLMIDERNMLNSNLVGVLGKVGNSENIPGVLKHTDTARNSGNRVSWYDVVHRNL